MSHFHYAFGKRTKTDTRVGGGKHYHMAYDKEGILVPTSAEYDKSGHIHVLSDKESSVPIVLSDREYCQDH